MSTSGCSGLWNRKSQQAQQHHHQLQQQLQPQLIDSSSGNSETSSIGSFSMEEDNEYGSSHMTMMMMDNNSQQLQEDVIIPTVSGMERGMMMKQQQQSSLSQEQPQRLLGSPQHQHQPPPLIVDPNQFTYRAIQKCDRDRVKQLHEEWFPVTYQDEFYNDLAEGHLAGAPVFTRVALYNGKPTRPVASHAKNNNNSNDSARVENSMAATPTPADNDPFSFDIDDEEAAMLGEDDFLLNQTNGFDDDTDDADYGEVDNGNINNGAESVQPIHYNFTGKNMFTMEAPPPPNHSVVEHNHIIDEDGGGDDDDDMIAGCIVGSFLSVTRLPQSLRNLLVPDPLRHSRLFYIMTLGTVSEYRHAGLGTRLVQQCIEQVEQDVSCGTLYLHCITFNQGAIRLYEKLGFYRVQEIPDYYDIQGEKYPCYLYAKYFHGNQGHRDIYKMIAQCVWSFVQQVLQLANIPSGVLYLGGSGGDNNGHHHDSDL